MELGWLKRHRTVESVEAQVNPLTFLQHPPNVCGGEGGSATPRRERASRNPIVLARLDQSRTRSQSSSRPCPSQQLQERRHHRAPYMGFRIADCAGTRGPIRRPFSTASVKERPKSGGSRGAGSLPFDGRDQPKTPLKLDDPAAKLCCARNRKLP